MPQPRARGGTADAPKQVPSLTNNGYFSDYYLAHRLDSGLVDLYAGWDAAENNGDPTDRTRLRALTTQFHQYRADAVLTEPDADILEEGKLDLGQLPTDGTRALLALNDAVLAALGWAGRSGEPLELTSGDTTITVPAAHVAETATGVLLVALDIVFATNPDAVIASKTAPTGRLVEPLRVNNKPVARTALEAAQIIFTADNPPSYLLFVSGGAVTLLDRDRWGEGISLGANLDDALARHDTAKKGELAALAALFSAGAINPGDGAQSVLTGLLEKASSESAGVSKELRHGIRRSIEILADAVVRDIRYRQNGPWMQTDTRELTRQTLRYLYRIIVLLFAEARPELGILPSDDPDYQDGYSVARLREVALAELQSDHDRNSRHIQHSLARLFTLVNEGHATEQTFDAQDARELVFPRLNAFLFSPEACPMVDRAHLADELLQQVIAHLCFTQERSGRTRQPISYATLGINQLGAVYEGLMAYSGFLATEPLYEIDKDGDPDNGSWVISVERADEFPDELFLTNTRPDGSSARVEYEAGDFVFRLSGRDRQRSASYYTPEVLTEFTVRHALDVLFEENPGLTAAGILDLTVCEPALGSGAFLTEAITQLAERYLKQAQDERGDVIDADTYQRELQKAKAHFAINQAFGVDLNRTAIELAEVSLWLACMHEGLQAPWFGARLRTGDSLIGSRRETYSEEQIRTSAWAGNNTNAIPPTPKPISAFPLGDAVGIHHFLVPGQGWGAAADAREIRELDPDWRDAVHAWRSAIRRRPSTRQLERLRGLSARAEVVWAESRREVEEFWDATRQHIDVWGAETPTQGSRFGEAAIRTVLEDPRSATCRLRTLMDAWCSLWLWAPQHGTEPPTLDEWITVAEALLRIDEPWETGALFADERELPLPEGAGIEEIAAEHPWLATCREIATTQGWFHWELEFSPVFERGGFDLQVGNPPWVRPTWTDEDALAEYDPWFGVTGTPPEEDRLARREAVLQVRASRAQYLAERAENAALSDALGAVTREPLLVGQQTNLYLLFITGTWRRAKHAGSIALLHPGGHLSEQRAVGVRAAAYRHYREHFYFINELQLFAEISHTRPYAVNVYSGDRGSVEFTQAAFLYHPLVADRSLTHDGTGELPGRKLATGEWDLRPHRERLVHVNVETLASWAALLAEPAIEAPRVVLSVTTAEAQATRAIAEHDERFGSGVFHWTSGWHEMSGIRDRTIEWHTDRPRSLDEAIIQGPHIGIANPAAKEARASGANQQDYDVLDLLTLPSKFIPRTNLRRGVSAAEFASRVPLWAGVPHTNRWRFAVRKMVPSNTYRSMFAAMIPKGITVGGSLSVGAAETDIRTLLFAGLLASLPIDFLIRAIGVSNFEVNLAQRFPMILEDHVLAAPLAHRTARLNCVTEHLAGLWEAVHQPEWIHDELASRAIATRGIGAAPALWDETVPLRAEHDRWLALCEIDALAALILGIRAAGLSAIYLAQFPVLLGYEHEMLFDTNGHQVCGDHHQHGYVQAQVEAAGRNTRGWVRVWDRVQSCVAGDDSVDVGPFLPPFRPADRVAAMTHAYWTFVERYDLTPPDTPERTA